jgi:hypothetical protein
MSVPTAMRSGVGVLEGLSEAIASAVPPLAVLVAALGLSGLAVATAIGWLRDRRGSNRTRETLFVGRWGVLEPELYLVGKRVRRLAGAEAYDRCPSPGHPRLGFAREILAVVMRCPPATKLAWDFADAQLAPMPPDGFVLSTSEVEAWLETRERVQSSQATR